jgi:hypothetical protein
LSSSSAGPEFCGECGTRLKPLLTSKYCPRDCDRKPKSTVDDDWVELEITEEFVLPACPGCKSCNTATFHMPGQALMHCWDCGHVW